MKLLFKQRFFSWFDSYDIYTESGAVAYTVEGQLSWGHKLHVLNAGGSHIATVKQEVFTWLPKFGFYVNGGFLGNLKKRFTFMRPSYFLDFNGWNVSGNFLEWDYTVTDANGAVVATVGKQVLNWTDTYVLDVVDPANALLVLMFTLAIDAEKCSRS